jgi:RNA polymerase sigma factor (sigma-70 family)
MEIVALDEALDLLARDEPRKAKVVELRFFGGLTEEEISKVLGVSVDTVTRDWRFARAWLRSQMES